MVFPEFGSGWFPRDLRAWLGPTPFVTHTRIFAVDNVLCAYFKIGLLSMCLAASTLLFGEEAVEKSKMLSVLKAAEILADKDWVLVDTRVSDAFNGWCLDGVSRGGHLPGAVDFPASWLDSERADKEEVLASELRKKGIDREKNILLYSSVQEERVRVAEYLEQLGYEKLYQLDFDAWANEATRPLVRYEHYELLVPPAVVWQLLKGELPETFEQTTRLKFAEVSWGDEGVSYKRGHVPKSFHVNTDHFEPPPSWYLGDRDILREFAKRYGFRFDDTVILSGADPTASYRLAIVLRYMGVADVRVLNGGFQAWKVAGYAVETETTLPEPVDDFGAEIPGRPELIIGFEQVEKELTTPSRFTLVDTRTWAEFTGKTSGYTYHFRKGRIPGSVYGQADFRGKNSLTPYRNMDNTMRNADEILDLWMRSGVETRKHVSFMCGGGWRAAEVMTFANVMGLDNASLYSDGWIGWSNAKATEK
jgi:3-mercaptopyruvate sulfurtransferase SseA